MSSWLSMTVMGSNPGWVTHSLSKNRQQALTTNSQRLFGCLFGTELIIIIILQVLHSHRVAGIRL